MSGPLLDQASIGVAAATMLAMVAVALFHVATHAPAPDTVRMWGRSGLIAAFGFALMAFSDPGSSGPLPAIGNLALGVALILQVAAVAGNVGHGDRLVRLLLIITVVHAVAMAQFAGLDPNPLVQVVCSHLLGAVALFAAALIGWRPNRTEFNRLGRLLAATYAAGGLLSLALGLFHWEAGLAAGDAAAAAAVRDALPAAGDPAAWGRLAVAMLHLLPPLALLALSYSQLARQLACSATLDPLTQAVNRRGLAAAWDLLQARARRGDEGWHVGVVMLDIDHFKSINQAHGHAAGDAVLQLVVDVMRQVARRYDIVARFGGEEFCMLLPGVTIRQAQVVTERIRRRITEAGRERTGIDVTVSAGITVANAGQTGIEQAVDAADQMLYIAKQDGRDRSRVDPDALRVIAGLAPVARSGKADELGFPLV